MTELYYYSDFEGFSDSTKGIFVRIGNVISKISVSITSTQCVLACIATIVNVFHLIVLTKKSMRSNSINVIMIGIAVCDLFNMSFMGYDTMAMLLEKSDDCRPPPSYTFKIIGFWTSALEDHSRRLSACFGVLMALIRYLIVRNALNPKFDIFSKSLFAIATMSIAFILSTLMTWFFWSRYEFLEVKPWKPPIQCPGFPLGYTVPQYKSSVEDIFLIKVSLALQIFSVVDGLFKLVPTIMFPILTFLLVKELRKAESSRRKISNAPNANEHHKADQTTKLVILMAITYMAAEGPLGILYVFQGFVTHPAGIVEITFELIDILGTFGAINAISHCLICFGVSSQYRKSAKELFFCAKCSRNKINPTPYTVKVSVTAAPHENANSG